MADMGYVTLLDKEGAKNYNWEKTIIRVSEKAISEGCMDKRKKKRPSTGSGIL